MREYEIRVLSSGHPIVITEEMHVSDHAAVRSAKTVAAGRPFQVLRASECIYWSPGQHEGGVSLPAA